MEPDYLDGTVLASDPPSSIYDLYVKDSSAGWEDRVWFQPGSDVPTTLPSGTHRVIGAIKIKEDHG